jgi:hypothetical protein
MEPKVQIQFLQVLHLLVADEVECQRQVKLAVQGQVVVGIMDLVPLVIKVVLLPQKEMQVEIANPYQVAVAVVLVRQVA